VTTPPLPESPVLRVRLDYTATDAFLAGNRFFLGYGGSAPSGANCTSIAAGIEAAWVSNLAPLIETTYALSEVDVLDIATVTGFSGQWTGTENGTRSGTALPQAIATNVEYGIARRYRGGKPRMYLPPGVTSDLANLSHWEPDFIDAVNSGVAAFFTEIGAISVGEVGALTHVNVSYYSGFKNITNSSGRERAVPQYRDSALVESVLSYSCKGLLSSQKRRRDATSY
jgi:hypothetical protein